MKRKTRKKMETCELEVYDKLHEVRTNDPARKAMLDEIKVYSDIRVAEEKSANEKRKNGTEIVKAFLFVLAGFGSGFGSYMMDSWFGKDTKMMKMSEKFHDYIIRK